MQVKQIMIEPDTISKDQRLSYALEQLNKKGVERLIVVQDGEVTGILTYADIADRLGVSKVVALSIQRLHVSSAMTDTVITVGPDDDVTEVAQLMIDRGMSGCPVVDENNKLVGVAVSIGRDTLRSRFNVPITNENSLTLVRVNFGYQVPIPDMTFYVPLDEIEKFLDEHKSAPRSKPLPKKKELPNPHKKWFYYFMVYPLTGLLVFLTGLGLYRAYRGPRRR